MRSPKKHSGGFTLVEIMVSMVIGSVVLLAAVAVLRSTGDGYERVSGGVIAEREARALLGQIHSDLRSATYHEETLFEEGRGEWRLDRVGFLSLQPDDAQTEENLLGDLCGVRYYVADQNVGGKTVRCLMRGFSESNETFTKLRDKDVKSLFTEPASGMANVDEAIAFGILSFEVTPKKRDDSGKLAYWSPEQKAPPELVVIRIVVARRELVGKLADSTAWDGKGAAASLTGAPTDAERNKNLQVYETTVRFGHHEEK